MLSLHTNNAALSAQNAITQNQSNLSNSMTRLSTGHRVNTASDDAAGLQIATRLIAQTSGMAIAMKNTQNSTSMLQTASGAFSEVNNMLIRMKDLATQAADASQGTNDKAAAQAEYDALGRELYNVMTNTTFGGNALLTGGTLANAAMTFQIGAGATETMSLDLTGTANSGMQGLGAALFLVSNQYAATPAAATGTELTTATTNNAAITNLNAALAAVGTVNSALGATINRLDHVNSNLMNISTNTQAATGRIMDTDYASESSNMTQNQMLLQAGTAMLKQSNSLSSMVMSLLQ